MSRFFLMRIYCFTVESISLCLSIDYHDWNIHDYSEQHNCCRKNFITCISLKRMYVFRGNCNNVTWKEILCEMNFRY